MDVMEIRPDADPADALAAVAALRRLADQLEDVAVERAMRAGAGRRLPRRSASPGRRSTRSTPGG